MTRETKRKVSTAIRYTLLILVGFIMVYPLIWMVGATFKKPCVRRVQQCL